MPKFKTYYNDILRIKNLCENHLLVKSNDNDGDNNDGNDGNDGNEEAGGHCKRSVADHQQRLYAWKKATTPALQATLNNWTTIKAYLERVLVPSMPGFAERQQMMRARRKRGVDSGSGSGSGSGSNKNKRPRRGSG